MEPNVSHLRPAISLAGALSGALLMLSATLAAANPAVVAPGEYEMTVGVAGNNMTSQVCYHDKDVEILPALILTLEEQQLRKDCTVEILEQGERSAKWKTRCQTRFMTRSTTGSITWTNTSFNGQALRTMGSIRMEFPFAATRRNAC